MHCQLETSGSTGIVYFNPFRTAKPPRNGNHRLCLKQKPQVKCH